MSKLGSGAGLLALGLEGRVWAMISAAASSQYLCMRHVQGRSLCQAMLDHTLVVL